MHNNSFDTCAKCALWDDFFPNQKVKGNILHLLNGNTHKTVNLEVEGTTHFNYRLGEDPARLFLQAAVDFPSCGHATFLAAPFSAAFTG